MAKEILPGFSELEISNRIRNFVASESTSSIPVSQPQNVSFGIIDETLSNSHSGTTNQSQNTSVLSGKIPYDMVREDDPLEAMLRKFRSFERTLQISQKYNDIPDITPNFQLVTKDFRDGELINRTGIRLCRMELQELVNLGRDVIPMLRHGFTEQGAAAIFILAYNLRVGVPNTNAHAYLFPSADSVITIGDLSFKSFGSRFLSGGGSMIPLGPSGDTFHEANSYCFIAASVLRIFSKPAESYVKGYGHIVDGYRKFFGTKCRADMPGPSQDAMKALTSHYAVKPSYKVTLYKLLYLSGASEEHANIKGFLYDLHLSYTGLHVFGIFIRLCEVLDCQTGVLISAINYAENRREVDYLVEMLKLMDSKEEHHKRRMWRFGRLFDENFMEPLRTKYCPMLTYTLASALKSVAPQSNQGILNITQLADVSPEKRRLLDVVADQIVRKIRGCVSRDNVNNPLSR